MLYQLINQVFLEEENVVKARDLAKKDFQRLERLLKYDFPEAGISFDYSKFNEFNLTLLVDIPTEYQNLLLSYLANNYYQFTSVGGLSDTRILINALSRVLTLGKDITHKGNHYTFNSFGKRYRGYLDNFPGRPGLHENFEQAVCTTDEHTTITLLTKDISLAENPHLESEILMLDPSFKREIYENTSFLGDLPPTKFYEGDVVSVIDFAHHDPKGQSLVFRVCWDKDPLVYKVKSAKNDIFEVAADSLSLKAEGATRMFYKGCPPKYWKDIAAEADFYVLLGFYDYIYNGRNDSYAWTADSAKKAIANGEGHAMLSQADTLLLIRFGPEVPEDTITNVVEASMDNDLVLSG